jgi:alpha-D-ribose 1-methylphosphonate 5-triphosphate synthase subunit PhnH
MSMSALLAQTPPGLADPVHDAQRCFRAVLDAMAHPGRVVSVAGALAAPPPAPLGEAAGAQLLTLCDIDTPLWLSPEARSAATYLQFHCGAPIARSPQEARFALVADAAALPALDTFALGEDEYPDRSTTLVLQVADLAEGSGATLRGPGIQSIARLAVDGLPAGFWEQRAALQPLFPRGLDIVFACGSLLAAVPRSTMIEG